VDEREDHRCHTGVETQQEPRSELQADRDLPDSEANVTEEQNYTSEGEWHPDRVDPVSGSNVSAVLLESCNLPSLTQEMHATTHMANDGTRTPTTIAKSWVPVGKMFISSTEYL
jgi:hypothetical protein